VAEKLIFITSQIFRRVWKMTKQSSTLHYTHTHTHTQCCLQIMMH